MWASRTVRFHIIDMQREEMDFVFAALSYPSFCMFLCFRVFMRVPADVMEGKSAILLGMSQWNSNDLVEQIETLAHMEDQTHGTLSTHTHTHTMLSSHSSQKTHFPHSHINNEETAMKVRVIH